MSTDLMKRMIELATLEEGLSSATGPLGSETKYIVHPGEIPWWKIAEPKERNRVCQRQGQRMWHMEHPRAKAEAMKRHRRRHPEAALEAEIRHEEKHPGARAKIMEKFRERHVNTNKTPDGTARRLPSLYKKTRSKDCELCRKEFKKLDYHHWIFSNPSVGIWVCYDCNQSAEAIDGNGSQLGEEYTRLKRFFDELYADGNIVELAKKNNIRSYLKTTVNGTYKRHLAWGKRSRPGDNTCELCKATQCYNYHHWQDEILGKGLWLCNKCHKFAERFDAYGQAIIDRYLTLKTLEEQRVLVLMKADSIRATPDMFPGLSLNEEPS